MGRHLWKYSNNQDREHGWGAQGGVGSMHVRVMVYRRRYPMSGTQWTLQPTISVRIRPRPSGASTSDEARP